MPRNLGKLPGEAVIRDDDGQVTGYRQVRVRLFNGYDTAVREPNGWPAAGGRPPTRWSIESPPHPFDIEYWELI